MSNQFRSCWNHVRSKVSKLHIGSSYWALYRLLDDFESRCILIVGIICAIAAGIPLPLIAVVIRGIIEEFPPSEEQVQEAIHYVLAISAAYFILTWIWTVSWGIVGGRISRRLQEDLVERIMGLDMQYFDTEVLDLSSLLTADTQTIQRGTSEKVGLFIQSMSYFVATFITGLVIAPALTGVLLAAIFPSMILIVVVGGSFVSKYSGEANRIGDAAANAAEQAIRAVQVVQAFGAADSLCNKHAEHLHQASSYTYRKTIYAAIMLGLVYFAANSAQALAFYWGTELGGNSGTIYAVVFLILDASFVVNQVGPFIQTIAMASSAGSKVLDIVNNTKPSIDPYARLGAQVTRSHLRGNLTMEDVTFSYPTRQSESVVKNVNVCFAAGTATGIVGASGSGKSSLVGLLLRLYDPSAGCIRLGGINLTDFNVKSLRSHIALVDQDPVLFTGTILENIRSGIPDDGAFDETEIRQRCEKAAQDANADDFISQLDHGIDTNIGSATFLSGGQRQRICLARALVRQPSVIILDEPTSALDSLSEAKILESIQHLRESGCTIVMIAHRLATVKDLDNILVFGDGSVLESGSHQALLDRHGAYKALVEAQQVDSTPSTASSGTKSSASSSKTLYDQSDIEKHDWANQASAQLPVTSQAAGALAGQIDPPDLRRNSSVIPTKKQRHSKSTPQASETFTSGPQLTSWQVLSQTAKFSKPEWMLFVFGVFTAGVMGCIIVYEAIVFGNLITLINEKDTVTNFSSQINFFCLMYFVIALIALTMSSTSNCCFGLILEALLTRIRDTSLRNILNQDQSFFQSPEHSPHRLIAAMNSDINNISGLTGTIMTSLITTSVFIISGVTIAIAYAWAIALILLTLVPAIVLAGLLRVTLLRRFEQSHTIHFKHAASLASEAVQNIRTVAAYGREHEVLERYKTAIAKPYRQSFWFCVWGNLALTLNYCIVYFTYALAYWWGSKLVRDGQFTQKDFFTMLPAFLLAAQQSGNLFTAAPELVQARSATRRLYAWLEEKPTIIKSPELLGSRGFLARDRDGTDNTEKKKNTKQNMPEINDESISFQVRHSGCSTTDGQPLSATLQTTPADSGSLPRGAHVELDKVTLSYPRRPEKTVLHEVSLLIEPGQSVGIVGPSGAGKSTFISLLERFYDPTAGRVLVDGGDIKAQAVDRHRARLALVSQDPSLFAGSVAFNIGLGASPYALRPSQDEVEAICKKIGMHDFVMSLPDGYATECGSNGSRLSGGQKQRVAIARALIRDPELLILDEATSALDSHSEKQVQQALGAASRGRTTITVAHRLSTMRDVDVIYCFDKGRLVEQGTHEQLVKRNGVYAGMVSAQSLH